jgi:hypothetical protein
MIIEPEIPKVKQPGYIYLIRLVSIFGEKYKIGKTRNIKNRKETLYVTNGMVIILIAYGYSPDSDKSERDLQNMFYVECIGGEYFRFSRGQVFDVMDKMQNICDHVITDITYPVCPNDGIALNISSKRKSLTCKCCDYSISFDNYMRQPQRLLPYSCDELSDDDNYFFREKYDSIYNWRLK